jgi:hypothetical protein
MAGIQFAGLSLSFNYTNRGLPPGGPYRGKAYLVRPLTVLRRTSAYLLLSLALATSTLVCRAQDKPDAPAPKQTTPPASQPAQNPGSDQDKNQDAQIGKSKLEKETGTVNDRIFEVMPNYGTVETAKTLPPLTSGQKFHLATASVFDYFTFPFNGALAAIDQANNSPKSWGQGWGAYGKRYGASFADNGIGTFMTVAVFPSLLHEDPRYFQMGKGTFSHRAFHAVSRLFVVRADSGDTRFNYSELVGNATAAAFSNVYHAPEDRTAGRNVETLGFLFMWDGVSNELKEFWPDIRRKVFHKNTP